MNNYYTEEDMQAFLNTKKGKQAMQQNNNHIFKLAFEDWYKNRERKRQMGVVNPETNLEQFA